MCILFVFIWHFGNARFRTSKKSISVLYFLPSQPTHLTKLIAAPDRGRCVTWGRNLWSKSTYFIKIVFRFQIFALDFTPLILNVLLLRVAGTCYLWLQDEYIWFSWMHLPSPQVRVSLFCRHFMIWSKFNLSPFFAINYWMTFNV